MRARNIKPGFFRNDILGSCSFQSRLLFIGLWCMADKEGRLEKRPLRIKAEIFPYDSLDIHGELTVLERNGFILTYEVDGVEYIQVVNFKVHQNPHHTEAKSKLPDISGGCILTDNSPLNTGEYPADSLIPDSLIPDSSSTDSSAKPMKMMINEFRIKYQETFNKIMPGTLNAEADMLCRQYPRDTLDSAFQITAEKGGNSFSYLKAVIEAKPKEIDWDYVNSGS